MRLEKVTKRPCNFLNSNEINAICNTFFRLKIYTKNVSTKHIVLTVFMKLCGQPIFHGKVFSASFALNKFENAFMIHAWKVIDFLLGLPGIFVLHWKYFNCNRFSNFFIRVCFTVSHNPFPNGSKSSSCFYFLKLNFSKKVE